MPHPQAGHLSAPGPSDPWEGTCVKWPPGKTTASAGDRSPQKVQGSVARWSCELRHGHGTWTKAHLHQGPLDTLSPPVPPTPQESAADRVPWGLEPRRGACGAGTPWDLLAHQRGPRHTPGRRCQSRRLAGVLAAQGGQELHHPPPPAGLAFSSRGPALGVQEAASRALGLTSLPRGGGPGRKPCVSPASCPTPSICPPRNLRRDGHRDHACRVRPAQGRGPPVGGGGARGRPPHSSRRVPAASLSGQPEPSR